MELAADAVAAELAHHREAVVLGEHLDRVADVAQARAGLDLDDALPHGLVGEGAQALGGDRAFADDEHAAGVAVPAVLDDGDVDVDDVAVLQRPIVRNAVADLVVDRCADRLGVGRVAGRRVVQRRGDAALHIHDVLVRELVELVGRDAGLHVWREHVQHFGSQLAGDPHALNIGCGLDSDRHAANYVTHPVKSRVSTGAATSRSGSTTLRSG